MGSRRCAKVPFQCRRRDLGEISDRLHPKPFQRRTGCFTNPPQRSNRQRVQKGQRFARRHVPDTVRLGSLGSKFGEELVDRNTDRGRELEFFSEARPNFDPDDSGIRVMVPEAGHIEKGLVEREAFDQRGQGAKDSEHLFGDSPVFAVIRREHNRRRAETSSMNHRHRRGDAKGASFVGRRGNNAPTSGTANHHGAPAQIRSIPTFDLYEERIHVDVQDGFGKPQGPHSAKVAENKELGFLGSLPMASRVHLVRHGEVENPGHIVYADLQEFGLSSNGEAQAEETATYLSDHPITAVSASPLTRAVQTALVIAAPHGLKIEVDDDFGEFALSIRWRGIRWEALDDQFPGEVAAYLNHPWDLPFSPESLEAMAGRMEAAILSLHLAHPDGELVVVSHQDPLQAARFALTDRPFASFGSDKPGHAEVITLEPGAPWRETARWAPATRSGRFPPPMGIPGP